ncbi:MAG: TonB-dependent receptor [Pseudomonadota bacterium]
MNFGFAPVLAMCGFCTFPLFANESPRSGAPVTAGVLNEVVVTARRREETLQSVPGAISVLNRDLLDESNTVNTQQMAQLVPSLYYNSANPRNTAYTIRGLGSNTLSVSAANDGIEPGVGFYVDGVYHGRPATAAFDFTDIERVEVLRGPQGTLFGKNSAAGAIQIISRAPTFKPEASGEVSFGSDDYLQAKTTFSGALSERVAGRISAQLTRRDGLIHNVKTDKDLNTLNNVALRGQLLFQSSEVLSLRLIADLSDLDSDCCTQNYLRVGRSLRGAARQFPGLSGNLPAHGLPAYVPPSTNIFDRLTDIDADLHIDTQDGGIALNADWNVGAATLTSITAWRYWDWDVANDRDYIGVPIQLIQRIPSRQDQFSQEMRIAMSAGRLSYVGGLYFFSQEINGKPTSVYGPASAYWLISTTTFPGMPDNLTDGYGQYGNSHFNVESYAAFGEANFAVSERLTATLGLRYTYEDKEGSYSTTVSGGRPFSTLGNSATCTSLVGATLSTQDNAKLSLFRPQCYDVQDDGGSLSGRANLAWQFTDDLLGYVSYARGYKSGGLNMSGLQLTGGAGAGANLPALNTAIIDDERNNTAEVGLKSSWFGNRATLNLSAYRTTVEDFQANISTPVTGNNSAPLRTFPANIPEVRVQGAEADFAARVTTNFTLRASVAYADGEYIDYPQGPCPLEWQNPNAVGGCQPFAPPPSLAIQTSNPRGNPSVPGAYVLTGLPLAGLSEWVGSLGAGYAIAVRTGELQFQADCNVRSGYNSDTTNSIYTKLGGYGVVNASVGYQLQSGWEISVFARNLLAKGYVSALTIQTGNSGLILGQPSDPRLFGLQIRARM